MKKEIRFSSSIDTKDFDRAIEGMQRKLREIYQGSDASRLALETKQSAHRAGVGPAPTAADKSRAYQEDMRTRRELTQFIRDQVKENEKLTKQLQDQLKLKKELSEVEKKEVETIREKIRANNEAINRSLQQRQMPGFDGVGGFGGVLQRAGAAYSGAGLGGAGFGGRIGAAATAMGRGMGQYAIANPMGMIGGVAGFLGSATMLGSQVAADINISERERLLSMGSASRSLSAPMMSALNRGGFQEAMFAPERAKSLEKARQEIEDQKTIDKWQLAGKGLLALAAGAGGMVIGGPIGAAAAFTGASEYLGIRKEITDRLTGVKEAGYQAQQAQIAEQNFAAMKNLNPLKEAAFQRYERESMANLPFQRSLGLSDMEMQARLMAGTGAGFTTDITRQAMGGIIGAGGSTRAARGMATQANVLERNLGLTNASQAIGRISALTGDQQQTEQALEKVLIEAFSQGLDKSEFREEQKKFVNSAVDIITRTGAMTPETQQALTRGLSDFMTGPGMAQIQGAQTAFNVMSQTTATTQGARGAIQASILNRDSRFKDLNMDERNALLTLSEQQILAGGPLVEGILAKTGMSPEEIIKVVKRPAMTTRADIDKKIEQLKVAEQGSSERKRLTSEVLSGMGYDNPAILQMPPAAQEALIKSMTKEEMTPEEKEAFDQMQKTRLEQRKGEGPAAAGDKLIAAQAAGDEAMFEVMGAFKGELTNAADGAKVLATSAKEAADTIKKAYSAENFDPAKVQGAIDNLVKILGVASQGGEKGSALVQEKGAPSGQ